ncbi:ACP S-malonyltransferase [Saccharospirillum salsuginis]|uniref:Malonyl CoA-acyl carrier protein transacylase n=1 Tax=Saccharospirillum salsuginis TaxID=418750 RepID=A0A918K711_9GAMM|nr:ACP S-malonyltransferase [Saccharospirillum salsuginis]GGX51863.1 malonyl CoA-acyl carrier protein transacylase [Saccharospirillum salsuginis]
MADNLAFVFPGQGSQQVGMLSDLAEHYGSIRETFEEASQALGYDLWQLVTDGPADELNKTEKTQPALLTASTALWRLWQAEGGTQPDYLAGHSLGEYSALVAAEVLSLTDAVKLVEKRGQLMQAAVPAGEGGMAAILGLDDESVVKGCESAQQGDVVEAVNFNTPGQVVIAGNTAAVERAIEQLKEAGAKRAMPLPVSVPSHCSLMKGAAEQLADYLNGLTLKDAARPIVQNVTAKPETRADALQQNLIEQLYRPVLWSQTVAELAKLGVTETVECGPGKVLSGLNKRIEKSLTLSSLGSLAAFQERIGSAS